MKFKKQGKLVLAMSCSLVASALADNPISNYHYLADPAATAVLKPITYNLLLTY